MKNYSIWEDSIYDKYPPLQNDKVCDVLIIGGGLTGVATSYFLKDKGLSIVLVEKNVFGSGVSGKSTAKISYLQEDLYKKIAFYNGEEKACDYLHSQLDGIELIKEIIGVNGLDPNLEESPSYLFTREKKNIKYVKEVETFLKENFIKTTPCTYLPNKDMIKYGFSVEGCYTFNPINYLNGLAHLLENQVDFYEHSSVTELKKTRKGYKAYVNGHVIKAKKVVIACNYPFFLFPYLFSLKTSMEKSYLKAKRSINYGFNAISLDKNIYSIRYYQDGDNSYEITLGSTHNLATKANEKENFYKINYLASNYSWSNKDVYTKNYLPYIGKIKKNLFLSTGYQTWGMINSTLGGSIIADLIVGNKNKYAKLFSPRQPIGPKALIRYTSIAFQNSYSFIKGKLFRKKKWLKNTVVYGNVDGKKTATYYDQEGNKHTVYANCPHLGCSLIFNEVEKIWECPCHGSSFSLDGISLNGPSKKNIVVEEE